MYCSGFSLLEISISIFFITIGLLGFSEAQLYAMRTLRVQQQQQIFFYQLQNLSEQLSLSQPPSLVISQWQQQFQQQFSHVTLTLQSYNKHCYHVQLDWRQFYQLHTIRQTICADTSA